MQDNIPALKISNKKNITKFLEHDFDHVHVTANYKAMRTLNKLCRDLNNTFLSLTSKNGKLLNSEKKQRIKLKSLKNARI